MTAARSRTPARTRPTAAANAGCAACPERPPGRRRLGGVKGRAGAGDAYGVGGLGSRGTGQGGGGTAIGIGGLGTKGSGGGRGGYGEIDLGGRGKEETQFVPGRTIVVGGLSRDVINRIIQRHYNEVKYCYEKELTKDPALYGKVTVLFVIDGVGRWATRWCSRAPWAASRWRAASSPTCGAGRSRPRRGEGRCR